MRSVRSVVRWRSSLSNRAFSMAMTAWAAKFLHQFDLLIGKGPNFVPEQADCSDQFVILQHRNNKKRPYTPEFDGFDIRGTTFLYILLFGCKIG